MTRRLLAMAFVLVAASCGQGDDPTVGAEATPGATAPAVEFEPAVTVRFGDKSVRAEVAADDEQRQRGLMFRTEMGEDEGMLFIFPAATQGGFWMKNTLIPLSIAYVRRVQSADGADAAAPVRYSVVAILDMEPCPGDPCPSYPPGQLYDAALEVNKGWFERNGVQVGAEAVVDGTLPPAT